MNIKTDVSDLAQHLIVESMPVQGSKKGNIGRRINEMNRETGLEMLKCELSYFRFENLEYQNKTKSRP